MFTKELEQKIDAALSTLGVSVHGKRIARTLLENGPLRAKTISVLSGVRRELTYRALEELEIKTLIKKNDPPNGVSYFEMVHPELIIRKLKESAAAITDIQDSLSTNMTTLISTYNKGAGLPYVEFKEGAEGIKYLYKDVNDTRENIRLIRSPLDIKHPEIKKIVSNQIDQQVKMGIQVKLLTSFTHPSLEKSIERDIKNLVERRTIPKNLLDIPAQIIIYGEKVAITSFDGPIITTIIENKAIMETFSILFSILWNQAKTTQEMLRLS